MENDQVLTAGANLDADSRLRPSHQGHDIVMAAAGGMEIPKNLDEERRPLLTQDDETHSGRSESFNDVEQRDGSKWQGVNDFEGRPWWNKPSVSGNLIDLVRIANLLHRQVFWMLPVFLVATTSFGAVVVPRLDMITSLICRQYFTEQSAKKPRLQYMPVLLGQDNPQCKIPEVQSMVSNFTLCTNLIAGLLSAATSPKLGSLSDRYGRRRLIAATAVGALISEVITVLTVVRPDTVPVQWMYVGSFFDGLSGSFTASMALTFAYASDCTPPANRNVVFGWFHGCLFTGIALGPVIGGYIVKASGKLVTIFYITLILHCIYILFLFFIIPESLTKDRQMAARDKHAYAEERQESTMQSSPSWSLAFLKGFNVFAPLSILYPTGEGSTSALRRNLMLLAAVDTAIFGVAMGTQTVALIYAEYMFKWDTFETSIFLSTICIFRVSVLLMLLPLISRIVRGPKSTVTQQHSGSNNFDLSIIRVAIFFDILGYVGYSIVKTGPLYIISGIVASIGGMSSPTLGVALTKHVPDDRTGQVLGAAGLLHALARVAGPTIFNLIYSLTVATMPQTVFVCLTVTFSIAFVLSWLIKPHGMFSPPHPLFSPFSLDGLLADPWKYVIRGVNNVFATARDPSNTNVVGFGAVHWDEPPRPAVPEQDGAIGGGND